ncbi:3D-(3,5/4)-trihydroxycyclohexane-1,2-dione acylhydrolase (decyclizing) [Priestia megaterium]|uniref:3D-(3,5/4)-trihydroxycyclohexane-1,2-dione hydrolase n=1 Tax=Priestia megaterium (strain ATCC 14581 / DSM 32 / CCUG 1817 / JCM 2506 / NBRC 15308 / NCIMB 9376 / NCTC 10342 / NRRL B-14308 / VKM B-512 / Ford 19) TaxID=1348623 RepID=A0A0B6AFI7_PRIM2|nr:3D-(3,5/4)-trihydroxycyclohexane-1,2-dione acylhydrolase (decyclizing) [Priestia megaterium]AJI23660.1 3,5/4-trihydroxycyclohexa-1,2-dione hydrolase [Priestia megaterium NBRC 15308 = ATCC 14581]KFN07432.1 thiamine pyrophosphate enzyme, central domain protein [Priestia megaterium]KGJ78900.1 3D-(3,5/4)-trihydroxycyclohexane-1,2-dione hydrolase [Priestia megaterium NBRC 15308 = ATCC 14581]MDR4234164.1 3D-(3,5/4)-trihydroxycyclohexane-1,2-dione acylhydrolase (decyclizing) [Priestia megaterium]M
METVRMTTAQALVKFLNQQYVEFDGKQHQFIKGIFTIFGHGNVVGLGQALEEDPGHLDVYQGRNEQGMANAAMAFAKQKHRKQIMACTSSVGPGSANMVTTAATASANNIPVLLLPGDVFATRQPDPVLQQIEQSYDLSISTNDAFRPVSKYWDRVSRPEQLMTAMINAIRVLTNPADTGAVTICLPQDVQGEAWDFPAYFFQKRVHRIERRLPTRDSLADAIQLMKTKKKPIIICGGGVRYSEAAKELKQFASEFHIPFGETQAGKSAVESDYRYNLGGIGVTGNSAANTIAKEADLVIGVGTRFTDFTTASKQLFQHPNVQFLTINTSEFHANKLDAVKLVADAKEGLLALMKELKSIGYQSGYTTEIANAKDAWETELERLHSIRFTGADFVPEIQGHLDESLAEYVESLGTQLTQTEVIGEVNKLLDDNSVIIGAAGSLPGDLQRMWKSTKPNTYHMEYGYSCMGYEVSGALGVKLAEPAKEVYAMVGDGSYQMLHSELITSLQERKKINILLFDNSGFGCINNLQMSNGMGSFGTEFRYRNDETGKLNGNVMKIDFAASAAGYGVKTYRVSSLEELKTAIEDAQKQEVSTLIDIKVLPKTMTNGYESWWHVGVAEVSKNQHVQEAYEDKMKNLEMARVY